MGLFDDIETPVDEITTDSFNHLLKPGGYEFQITDVSRFDFKDDHESRPGQSAIIFELTVTDGDHEDEIGQTYSAFCLVPNEELQGADKAKIFASILKQNMLQFGIPESRLNKWDAENPDDVDAIMGLVGTGKISINKKDASRRNLFNFELTEESGASDTELTPTATSLGEWKK